MKETAIRITNLKKKYRIGAIGGTTLTREIQSRWAKIRGKEDPNLKIGKDTRLIGETFWALNGMDLTIYKGEAVGIIGNNGAGKSTLLKILSQITAPTEGEVELYGRVASMLEVGTGFHGEMTGRENIYMNGAILGMTKAEIDARIEQIIEFSEVRDFIDTPVKRYSSGMFVKLAFAVAAHLSSEIMIMDEVLAVGDMAFQQKCLNKMREAAEQEGRTVLYVSHNMETIRRLCKRCIVLDQGKIIFDGDVEEAIAIYMNHAIGGSEVCQDLVAVSHEGKTGQGLDTGIFLEHLILQDKASPVYRRQEGLKLAIRFRVTRPLQNIRFRMTLRTDGDVGIGTSWSEAMNLAEGTYEKIFVLPLINFAKGIFYGSIGLYQEDELGRKLMLDHITRAFKIEVTGEPIWNTTAHGYMVLPEMKIEEKTG